MILLVFLFLWSLSVCSFVVPECSVDGQVRLRDNLTTLSSDYQEISGRLEICVDQRYQEVCGNDDADVDIDELIGVACSSIGYSGMCNSVHENV